MRHTDARDTLPTEISTGRSSGRAARELELRERIAELQRATEAISSSLARLAGDPTSDSAPETILTELSRQLGADICYWFDYETTSNTLRVALRLEKHIRRPRRLVDEPAYFDEPFDADITPAFRFMCQHDDFVLQSHNEHNDLFWPGAIEWHISRGRTESLAFAIKMGSTPLGVIGMAFVNLPTLLESHKTIIRALSCQLALAIHFTRTQERVQLQAVETALAEERARVEVERAEVLTRHNARLERQQIMLHAANEAARALNIPGNMREGLDRAFAIVGRQCAIDRVYSFVVDEQENTWALDQEWCAAGIPSVSAGFPTPVSEADFPEVFVPIRQGDVYTSRHVDRVGKNRRANEAILSTADLMIPVHVGGSLWGLVGFDLVNSDRDWEPGEIEILQSVAAAMGGGLQRDRAEEAQRVAIAAERTRLSEEMHDGIQQIFSAVALQLASCANAAKKASASLGLCSQIDRAAEIAEHGVGEVRRAVHALRDIEPMSPEKFISALESLCRSCDTDQISCSLNVGAGLPRATGNTLNELFRIVQEGVSNACKHSRGTRVRVVVEKRGPDLKVSVVDNGMGFDPSARKGAGLGLSSMRQRAARIGGELELKSGSEGTVLSIVLNSL